MDNVKVVCNWTRIGGYEWTQAVQSQFVDDEIIKPDLDELLKPENAILLRRKMRVDPNPELGNCELELHLCPRFKISALTLICTVPRLEIFVGAQNEYYETEHGCLIDEDQSEDSHEEMGTLRSYRYDIEIEKSGITQMMLKLPTSDDEICIFAILLQIAPNPNGVTTLLPNAINLENVQKMLESSNQKLTPSAEKCKQFLQIFSKASANKQTLGSQIPATTSPIIAHNSLKNVSASAISEQLKILVDQRMQEFESRILTRLDAFEARQSKKLDEIIQALQSLKKD